MDVQIIRGDCRSDLAPLGSQKFHTVLADPPWQFINRTGKVAPEHRRLSRYGTMTTEEICDLPVARVHYQHFGGLRPAVDAEQ